MAYYQAFGLTCPDEGRFYVCEKAAVQFVGCCTTDPCADGSGKCPQANLRRSNFSPSQYQDILEQDCDGYPRDKNWFTCAGSRFIGCCAVNPCSPNSCPNDSLLPAKLSEKDANRNLFLNPISTNPSGTSPVSSPTGSAVPVGPGDQQQSSGLSTGAIVGISVGVGVLFLLLVALLMYKFGWSAGKRKERKKAPVLPQVEQTEYDPNEPAPYYDNSNKSAGHANPFRESYMSASTAVSSPRNTMFSKHHQSMGGLSSEGPGSAYAPSEADPRQPSPSYSQLSFHSNAHTPTVGAATNLPVVYEMDSTSRPHEIATSDQPASAGFAPSSPPQQHPQNPQYMAAPHHHAQGPGLDRPATSSGQPPASPLASDSDAGSHYGSPVGSPRMPPPNMFPQGNGGYASVPPSEVPGDFSHNQNPGPSPGGHQN